MDEHQTRLKHSIPKEFNDLEFLGGGGQKHVFKARHPQHGSVALKVGISSNQTDSARIGREVDVLRKLDSPYFPKQFDYQVHGDRFVIVEEFVSGRPLDQLLGAHDVNQVVHLLREIVLGLKQLWEKRIVHRDVKPANILIAARGPVIIDLGIARCLDQTSLTASFYPFGPCTPNYASPEQLENQKAKIDSRSDQFSLGIVISQLLLRGHHPFDPQISGGASIPENILSGRWARREVSAKIKPDLYSILVRMLGREPYMRFRRVSDLLLAINKISL